METPPYAPRRIILRFRHGMSHMLCRAVPMKYGHPVVRDGWRGDQTPCLVVLVPEGEEGLWLERYPVQDAQFVLCAARERLS